MTNLVFSKGQLIPNLNIDFFSPNFCRKYFENQIKNSLKCHVYSGCVSNHCFIVKEKQLFGFGCNQHGQLGIGNTDHKKVLTFVSNYEFVKIGCGSQHSLFLRNDGKVFSCGSNGGGRLCLGGAVDRWWLNEVSVLDSKEAVEIESVFCGGYHSVLLSKKMDVFVGGNNYYGQLGTGDNNNRIVASKIFIGEKIVSVSCGGTHTLFISFKGNVYASGRNHCGQLGVGTYKDVYTPVRINFLFDENIVHVACSWAHSVFLTCNNSAYATGSNAFGQLGIGKNYNQKSPILISNLKGEEICKVKCGGNHTLFVNKSNKMWVTGSNKFGQLGNGNFKNVFTPHLLQISINEKICCSVLLENSSIYFATKSAYACGRNHYGQLLIAIGLFESLFGTSKFSKLRKLNNVNVDKILEKKFPFYKFYESEVKNKKEQIKPKVITPSPIQYKNIVQEVIPIQNLVKDNLIVTSNDLQLVKNLSNDFKKNNSGEVSQMSKEQISKIQIENFSKNMKKEKDEFLSYLEIPFSSIRFCLNEKKEKELLGKKKKYFVKCNLGHGAFGVVYKCWMKKRDGKEMIVAVKFISTEHSDVETIKKQVKNEIVIVKNLSHPGIIKIYGFTRQTSLPQLGHFAIVMEHCSNGALNKVLTSNYKISDLEKWILIEKITQSLNYLHKKKIIHRLVLLNLHNQGI